MHSTLIMCSYNLMNSGFLRCNVSFVDWSIHNFGLCLVGSYKIIKWCRELEYPRWRHTVIIFIPIRPTTPTELPLVHLCLTNHFHPKLSISLRCPFRIIWLGSTFQVDIEVFSDPRQQLPRLVPFLRFATAASLSSSLNTTRHSAEEILLHTAGVVMPHNAARRLTTPPSQG